MRKIILILLFGISVSIHTNAQNENNQIKYENEYKSLIADLEGMISVNQYNTVGLIYSKLDRAWIINKYYLENKDNLNSTSLLDLTVKIKSELRKRYLQNDSIEYVVKYESLLHCCINEEFQAANNVQSEVYLCHNKLKDNFLQYYKSDRRKSTSIFLCAQDFKYARESFDESFSERDVIGTNSAFNEMVAYQKEWNELTSNYLNLTMANSISSRQGKIGDIICINLIANIDSIRNSINRINPTYTFDEKIPNCNTDSASTDILLTILNKDKKILIDQKQKHNIPPIEFISAAIFYDKIGSPVLRLSVINNSAETVDAFEARIICMNRFNEPVDNPFYKSNKGKIINQETIEPGQEGGYLTEYPLYFQNNTAKIKIVLLRVHDENDKIWIPKEKQVISIIAERDN